MPPPSTSPTPRARRAPALPPAERRAALIETTVALLIEHGAAVSTRQIAEAAGIAEGTIFRVFPDKDELIQAALTAAFDPAVVDEALDAIDRSLPFETQLIEAVTVIQHRMAQILKLLSALRNRTDRPRESQNLGALAAIFVPAQDRLRLSPERAAQALRALTLAGTLPTFIHEPMTPEEIVALLLDGIRRTPSTENAT